MTKKTYQWRDRYCQLTLAGACTLAMGLHVTNLWAGTGQVIDEETRKPLANVFVMAKWVGHANLGAIGKTVCYDFAITQTDKDGRFSLPDWSWSFNPFLTDKYRGVNFYLQGYEWSTDNMPDKTIDRSDSGEIVLRRYKGPVMVRLSRLSAAYYEECTSGFKKRSKLLPFYSARYEEAQIIATTPEEKKQALFIKQLRDTVGLEPGELPRNPDGSIVK